MNQSNLKKRECSIDLKNTEKQKNPATHIATKKADFFGNRGLAKRISQAGVASLADLCCTRNDLKQAKFIET